MARRPPKTPARPSTGLEPRPLAGNRKGAVAALEPESDDLALAQAGEWLRRVALASLAALLTARAFWPSEPDERVDWGGGLYWVLAMLVVAGIGIAGALVGGTFRFRWSWADLGMVALGLLVGLSSTHAIDRRAAINIAWEWGGIAIGYLLVRWLPRTRGESSVLAGALVATAVSVSVYGLYQSRVEFPALQQRFLSHRQEMLLLAGVTPGTAAAERFEQRLLYSTEPYATFGLANSLAGFLVGPLVLALGTAWGSLTRKADEGSGSKWLAILLAVPPIAVLLVCLTLTKSRSAYIGLAVALVVLAWHERQRVRKRTLLYAAIASAVIVAGLITAGLATGKLDKEVLTQTGKSFGYRQQYWAGAWQAINETGRSFWAGYGPGNFAAPYLRHKLPEASEEIKDPHNFLLETWSTAGLWAAVALCVALGFGLYNAFGPASRVKAVGQRDEEQREPGHPIAVDPAPPPPVARWVLIASALGWVAALLVGQISLIAGGEFDRWLILGLGWAVAVGCGYPLFSRRPLEPAVLGAAALAIAVNLLAAGGISYSAVALALWTCLAVALNLRDDRSASRQCEAGGRVAAFAVAAVWVALLGTFVGAVVPHWKCEAALTQGDEALRRKPADFERAEAAYERAKQADFYSARPWLRMADLEYRIWDYRGAKAQDLRWKKIPIELLKALELPRPPDSWSRHLERARMSALLLRRLGPDFPPLEAAKYRANIVEATRKATLLYPSNASLHARLAEASADVSFFPDALKEAKVALELDDRNPHPDKKLEPSVRTWLNEKIPEWEKLVAEATEVSQPGPKGKKTTPAPEPARTR